MSSITKLVRPNIAALSPYSTARDEYGGPIGIFMDANESPYQNGYNRYPHPDQQAQIKARLGAIKGVPAANIFLGNGSDEAIDLIFRIFCVPGKDNAVIMTPSYGMYGVAAAINDIAVRPVQLGSDFSLDTCALLKACDEDTKVIFLCSPNNPSGNAFPQEQLLDICNRFGGIVVVDEAYVDFSGKGSLAHEAVRRDNLIVLQTLSKARAMAGLRVGMAISSEEIIRLMSMVKYPYNLSRAAMEKALEFLGQDIDTKVDTIIKERARLTAELPRYSFVKKVFPSDANFLLVKVDDANALYSYLLEKGIIVRNRSRVTGCEGCIRVTVGLPEENDALILALNNYERV
ncbi:MAG: histidinol-phosphate transaminase [Bacteroidales bacterium]|nr:histidinol-phosphate transaminase [Bacteroidales bacterium]